MCIRDSYKDVYDLLSQLEENIFVRLEEISVINSSPDWDQSTYHYLEDVLNPVSYTHLSPTPTAACRTTSAASSRTRTT